MDALILDRDYDLQLSVARALTRRGCTVICVDTVAAAEAFIRRSPPELLVMAERIDGRLTHPVALLAECQRPDMAAILLSDRQDDDLSELFDLLPAVRAVCGRRVDADTIGQVMLCVTGPRAVPVATQPVVSTVVGPASQRGVGPSDADAPPVPDMIDRADADMPGGAAILADAMGPALYAADGVIIAAESDGWRVDQTAAERAVQSGCLDGVATAAAPPPPLPVPVPPPASALADPGHQTWRAALALVEQQALPQVMAVGSALKAPDRATPVAVVRPTAPVIGAPQAAWWEDWEQDSAAAAPPARAVAGGRRMSLG
jgi:hypothetical protein